MSVREQVLFCSDAEPYDQARAIAELIGADIVAHPTMVEVLMPTSRLLPHVDGQFGGPLVSRDAEWPYRPAGEWEAGDAYKLEWRLWQAPGARLDASSGADLEFVAASAVFDQLAAGLLVPMLHIHRTDRLVAAFHPDHGLRRFAEDVTIYDWDEAAWGQWVCPRPTVHGR